MPAQTPLGAAAQRAAPVTLMPHGALSCSDAWTDTVGEFIFQSFGAGFTSISYHRCTRDRRFWRGLESRFDDDGAKWTRSMGPMVADDFGQLVPVGGVQ